MNLFSRYTSLLLLSFCAVLAAKGQTAGFTASPTSGCAPLVVHFTNTSSSAASYYWNLGNLTTSYLTNPSASYLTPGTYTISLTAYNSAHTDSSVTTRTITVYPSPTVSFVANDTAVCPGAPVTFTSTGSSGVSGSVTYSWNFGDGDSSNLASPSHAFVVSGYKNITLSVTNSEGCQATATVGAYIDVYTPAAVNFSATPLYICKPPEAVNFSNTTSGAAPLSYTWSFGDLSTSTATNPTDVYTTPGSYTVKLIVTDGHGCKDSLTRPAYIYVAHLVAGFTAAATACINTPVMFHNTSTTPYSTSTWNFGGSGTSTLDSPTHSFPTAGTFSVTLVVFDGHCYDTVTHTITIYPQPVSSFTWSPTDPCPAPATEVFTATAPPGTVQWEFSDGGSPTGTSTSHTFGSNGVYTVSMIETDGNGCKDTVSHTDTIYNLLVDISHIMDSGGCAPLTLTFVSYEITTTPFSATYPYGIGSYTWNFGDGSPTSSAATPTHTFTAVGVYTVTLTVVTANGCIGTATKVIRVGTPPVAGFTAVPTHICADRSVTFTNTSTGADSYSWFFGDGSGSTLPDPVHMYSIPADTIYTVTLIAYYNGCPDTFKMVHYITVDSPKAIISNRFACIPATSVDFGDSSLGDDTHIWFFGDGDTSSLDNPVHNYPALTIYTITLTTYNMTSGCRDTESLSISLVKPVLHFTADDTALCKYGIVHISSFITGGTASLYSWQVNGLTDPYMTDSFLIDTFNVSGLYSIRMIIQDGEHCLDTLTKPNYLIVAKPVDSFTVAPPTTCWGLGVLFTDHTTDVPGTTLTNYKWTFGDGSSTTVTTPTVPHTYTAAGTYAVQEIVTDNIGCKDTLTNPAEVTVYKPAASFYASNTHPCKWAPVTFTNLSTGIAGSFWMFGDGDTSNVFSPIHAYSATGAYTVKLVVTDIHGCKDTASYTNYINITGPHAGFYMLDSFSLCPPLAVSFINTSTGATSYNWFFGDGSTSILTSPSDLYTAVGYDTILLVARDAYGCLDTAVGHVNLFGSSGGFFYGPLTGCAPLTVSFGASINNVPNIIWDFADGTTSSMAFTDSITHTYTIPGAYVPKLVLSDNTGCQKSSQGIDTIKVDGVTPGFTTVPHPVCLNTPFSFKDTSSALFAPITGWHWTLAPGDTSDLSAPTYTYTTVGSFPVTLVVTDGWGCTGEISESVTVFPPPVISVSPDTVVCVGDPASLTGSGGISYTWSPPATLSCTACAVTQASPTVVTQYTVTGTDINGCQNTDTVTVFLRTKTLSTGWGDTAICQGNAVTVFDSGASKYTWVPATGLSNANIADPTASPNATTTYTVIAQLGSCIPDTNYVTIIVHPLPSVNAGEDQSLIAGATATLNATGTNIGSYLWTPGATLSCDSCATTVASMSVTTTYTVDVTSAYGCKASDSVTIFVACDKSQVFIPNSFTPNNDGQNDVFYPRGVGISLIKSFRIYNRWGELLFERTNIGINDVSSAWDGTYNNSSPRPDVYVYVIDAVCETGAAINLKGDVTIIR